MKKTQTGGVMDNIVSLAKRRGFIYQGSEIYGGLAGTWDYGPLGVALKNNVKNAWWKRFVDDRDDMYGVDAALLMNPKVWEVSGHVAGFSDPLVEDKKTNKRYRADHLLEASGIDPKGMSADDMSSLIKEKKVKSPDGNDLGEVRQFNMMFKTHIGAAHDDSSISYLRPETAQGMFVNLKNIMDSFHPKPPFGLAQIGRAFRNEIAPRDFIFRTREFEQMEIEYFIKEKDWTTNFEYWRGEMWLWIRDIGLDKELVHELEVAPEDRAHYSKRTIDFEFDFPFGRKELYGLAYRTDFDLRKHAEASGADLAYFDESVGERSILHVIEPTFGLDRTILALLCDAYTEDEMNGEKRVYMKFTKEMAPIKAAVFPLLKNKPQLVEKAYHIFSELKKSGLKVVFDDNGNIGKRYRRQDEIGTPFCITVDFESLADNTVTVRERDSGVQTRVLTQDLKKHLGFK